MLNYNEIDIREIIIHHIGSKSEEEGVEYSNASLQLGDESLSALLMKYFFTSFKPGELFHLTNDNDVNLNVVYTLASSIFTNPNSFIEQSKEFANHLYEKSAHPKIKSGDLYVVYLANCFIEGETVDAIGLFKAESKDTFLKVQTKGKNYTVSYDEGTNVNKLDKGCLIFNMEQDKGYLLAIVDNINKGPEAQYWRDSFLQVKSRKDEYHQTKSYLDMCKTFVLDHAPKEFETTKADQADFLNKSATFFKKNEEFAFDDFADQVIQQPEVIKSFKEYKKQYEKENDVEINDEFIISAPAVRKQNRIFKSVIKLDKNFHIYVHGNREYITRGFDEQTGMYYYQLYFKKEE
jgi:hypothetical protein